MLIKDWKMSYEEHVELIFHGLDTICRLVLNGKTLEETKNMHRRYVFDVKDRLVLGENRLRWSSPLPLPILRR